MCGAALKLSAPAAVASAAGTGVHTASALAGAVAFRAAGFGHVAVKKDVLPHRKRKTAILYIFSGIVLSALGIHIPAHNANGNTGANQTNKGGDE